MQEEPGALQHDWIRRIAEAFVGEHYAKEQVRFERVWEAFQDLLACRGNDPEELESWVTRHPVGLGVMDEKDLAMAAPIVLATVSETLSMALIASRANREGKPLASMDYATLVSKAAPRYGAKGELLARLNQHLPKLCRAVLHGTVEIEDSEQKPAVPEGPQFEVWTGGNPGRPEQDISVYESKKRKYLFWINLNVSRNSFCQGKEVPLQPRTAAVLLHLVKHLGDTVLYPNLLARVWSDNVEEWGQWSDEKKHSKRNRITLQLGKLNEFCGGRLEQYLVRGRDGLYLKQSFASQYFLFRRLR